MILRKIMKTSAVKRNPEPQEPKTPLVSLESLEDIAWELWLLIELLAPVRRRLPNTASQKLVDYVKDRLIAKSVALAKWKKARPELFPDSPVGAREVLPGENWTFPDHRTLAEVIEAERGGARVLSKAS
jgi:hypothetical protein